jgi:hypothetical protein
MISKGHEPSENILSQISLQKSTAQRRKNAKVSSLKRTKHLLEKQCPKLGKDN